MDENNCVEENIGGKIVFNKKQYSEVLGVVQEMNLEVDGVNLKEARKHFDEILAKHNFDWEKK